MYLRRSVREISRRRSATWFVASYARVPQETLFGGAVAIADFPQHPADSLVNQIVLVIAQHGGDGERVVELVLPDVARRGDHRDTPFPYGFRAGQTAEKAAVAVLQVRADDLGCRAVDQIPVVDPARVPQVQLVNQVARARVRPRVLPDQNEERQQALFVPLRLSRSTASFKGRS